MNKELKQEIAKAIFKDYDISVAEHGIRITKRINNDEILQFRYDFEPKMLVLVNNGVEYIDTYHISELQAQTKRFEYILSILSEERDIDNLEKLRQVNCPEQPTE